MQYYKLLAKLFYNSTINAPTPDIIIPMPLHKSKLKSRGFNQAEKLLFFHRVFANKNIINTRIATRIKETESHSLLTKHHRQNNIIYAFKILKNIKNLHIVIVDDIVTTGSTCNELAKALKLKGAKQVDIWCLMRA
ncbi:MAG TPA: phosphoribosyltransferase family protein [Burkholderiales bacterium]|nr:phosphoribosyltransferase family protein [Burkholderiales bacterium]